MKRSIRKIIILFFMSLIHILPGVSPLYAEQAKEKLYQGSIVIGIETWTGYFPLIVAREKGFFKEAGLDLQVKRYIALGELSRDYVAGKMQGRANLTLDAVKESMGGMDHKVVLAIDYSNGADAIVATQAIQSVENFSGKKVGFEPGTLEEFFVSWALSENGINFSDIVPVFANPEDTARKLKAGEIDVAVSHEPFLSQFLTAENFHTVYSSKDAPGLITDVLTFRTDFIEAHPETVEAIIRIYFKALDFWREHPEEANAMTAREFQDTPEGIASQLQGVTMLDLRDNTVAFTFAAGLRSLYGNLRQIGKFVHKHQGETAALLDTDKLLERRFIKKMMNQENP